MKKSLFILFLVLCSFMSKAQFSKPTGAVTIPTYSFFRNPADSSITIYQGGVNLYNTFLMKWDSVKVKGYFTNYKILQYRKLNNHDSLSTLDERKYQSLTDTVTWGLGLSQSGHVTKVDTSSASILSRERALKEYALLSHNQSISTIIGLLDSLNNHYTKAQDNALLAGKQPLATVLTNIQDTLNLHEHLANKSTTTTLGTSNTLYPTQNAVKTYIDTHAGLTTTAHGLGASAFHADAFFQAALTNPLTGSGAGTSDYIPKYTGTFTLANSPIFINGTAVQVISDDTWQTKLSIQNTSSSNEYSLLVGGSENGNMGVGNLSVYGPSGNNIVVTQSGAIIFNGINPNGYNFYNNGTGYFSTSITTPTINLTTGATLNYFLKCTNTSTGASAWCPISSSQNYNGAWNAATNTPTLADGTGTSGNYYHCTVSGTVNFGAGNITFVGGQDDAWYNGTVWEKNPGAQYALTTMTLSGMGGAKLGSGLETGSEAADVLNIKNEDKGDITVSGSGSSSGRIWTIDSEAVTYAKMQHISETDKVLGRVTAGAGDVEEISTTGRGNVVRATSPTLVTPALGTPSSGVATNLTGTATGLTSGNSSLLENHAAAYFQTALTNPYTGTGSAGQVAFHTGASTLSGDNGLFWDNTNKMLGLGTLEPGSSLEIRNTVDQYQLRLGVGTYYYDIGRVQAGGYLSIQGNQIGNNNIALAPTSGNVCIGNTDPESYKLKVNGTGYFNGAVISPNYVSNIATGTQPYATTSTTLNTNLNADLLDGQHGSYYQVAGSYVAVADTSGMLSKYARKVGPTFTGTVVLPSTTSIGTITNIELGYVDGVTSAIQTQFTGKEPTITAGTTAQYWRGDKSWQTLPTYTLAGLGGVALADSSGGAAGKYATGKAFQTHIALTTTAHGLGASAFHADNFFATAAQANATHSGDATGSTALTLATVNANVGTYNNITINGKGLATAGSNVAYLTTVDISANTNLSATAPIILTGDVLSISAATTIAPGSFSAADKTKLDGIASGATANTGTVTSVAALTLGTAGTDLSSSVATGTTTPVITLNVPTASAANRGALSAADWSTFNGKQAAGTYSTDIHSNITALNAVTNTNTGDQTTVSGNAGTVTVAANTTNATYYPLFTTSATGSLAPQTTAAKLTFNPSTGVLVSDNFKLSDRRLKNHIKPLDRDDIYKIAQVEFRKCYMNDDSTNKQHYVVIAQDVESAGLKELVNTDEKGTKSVNYTELLLLKVAQLEQVIKDQNRRIEKLENKNRWKAQQMIIQ